MRTRGESAFYLSRLISRREGEETLCNVGRFLGTSLKANGFVFFRSARMRERERERILFAQRGFNREHCARRRERERERRGGGATRTRLEETRSRGRGGAKERNERGPLPPPLFPPWRKSFRRGSYIFKGGEQFLLIFEKNCYSPCLLGPFGGVRHDCTTKFCHRMNQFLMWFFFFFFSLSRRLDTRILKRILFVRDRASSFKRGWKKKRNNRSNFFDLLLKRWAIFFPEDPQLCNSFIISSLIDEKRISFFFLFREILVRHALIFTTEWKMCG